MRPRAPSPGLVAEAIPSLAARHVATGIQKRIQSSSYRFCLQKLQGKFCVGHRQLSK